MAINVLVTTLLLMTIAASPAPKPYDISLSSTKLEDFAEYKYSAGYEFNRFELFLADASLLDSASLFIIMESPSSDFRLAFFDDPMASSAVPTPVLELQTNSGNLVFGVNANYYNAKLENFHVSGVLRLAVVTNKPPSVDTTYSLRFAISKEPSLTFGKAYTCYFDPTMNALRVNFSYDGTKFNDLRKLRFQLTVINKKADFMLNADLEHEGSLYELNGLFGHIIGGVLSTPYHQLCKQAMCTYQLRLKMLRVRSLNIESNLIDGVEKLSLTHFEEYYDRIYDENATQVYELPFEPLAAGLDVTFTLMPVSGITGLYINARTLPPSLDRYDWRETGPVAKRITVQHSDLVQMKAENSALFVAVTSSRPGEFLLRIDAHAKHFKGRLVPGVTEAGFLTENTVVNYIYFFEAFETQEVRCEVLLNLIAGDANLFLKPCSSTASCKITADDLKTEDGLVKSQSTLSAKQLSYSFKCEVKKGESSAKCSFAVALQAVGKERAYFELSLIEGDFHRLMHPGRDAYLALKPGRKVFLKFSHSPHRGLLQKLFVQILPHYGTFSVYMNKAVKFPTANTSIIARTVTSSKAGLYSAMETIEIKEEMTDDQSVFGIFYIAVEAETACSLSLKFFNKNDQGVTVHNLMPGTELRGQLSNAKELSYYTVKINPEKTAKSKKLSFLLTPLKGSYLMFLNTDASLPTKRNHALSSQDHHLEIELPADAGSQALEYVLGVQLNTEALSQQNAKLKSEDYQFYISCSHSSRPLRLTTGVISGHLIKEDNLFAIEVLGEMNDLLIVKGLTDGLNVQACLQFSGNEAWFGDRSQCKLKILSRQTALYLERSQLLEGCKAMRDKDSESACYLLLAMEGNANQKVQLGFVYNNHPFKLIKNVLFTLPVVLRSDAQIKMIFHAEQDHPVAINLNSKGQEVKVFSKLVRQDHFQDQDLMKFPDKDAYDADRQTRRGHGLQIFYNANEVSDFGKSPEVLLTITSSAPNVEGPSFDPNFYFTIQTTMETKELQRTQMLTDSVEEEQWSYYTFFNNGNSSSLRVYVCSTISSVLDVMLSKGLQSRPPFTNEPLMAKKSLGSVELLLTADDIAAETRSTRNNGLRGYYTLGVKSSSRTTLNLLWNNKEDLNYVELLPNIPTTMAIDKEKNLYFSFYAKKPDDSPEWPGAQVTFYLKTNVRTNLYVLRSQMDLTAPSSDNFKWKVSLGAKGGITSLRIGAKDPDYCSNCFYIAYLDSADDGQVSILANYNYSNDPVELTPGFTLPDEISPNEKLLYRVFNADNDLIDLTVTMLNGFIDVYVSDKPDLSEKQYFERFQLGETLETQKMIIIAPFRFDITGPHDYFILIHNPRLTSAAFTLSVDKNSLKSPIEPGITKSLHLAPGESTDFYYTPAADENLFQVKFELRQVLNEVVRQQAIDLLGDYIELYHMDLSTNSRYKLAYKEKTAHANKVYISFDIRESSRSVFYLHVYNPVGSAVQATLDLLNGGYNMLTYNEFFIDRLPPKGRVIYEGYGEPSKLFFIDLKTCHGAVKVEFFQGDYESVARNRSVEFKEIKNTNNIVNYIMLNATKAFVRLTNDQPEPAVFQLGVFTEKDLQGNPYSDLAQGNGGKVEIDSEHHRFAVPPASLTSGTMEEFRHRLTYTLFLAGDLQTMRYAKNCGDYLIDQIFEEPLLIKRTLNFTFNSIQELNAFNKTIVFELSEFPSRSRLYGVVMATIELFPKDESFFSPLRAGRVYYDEFIYKTPLFHIPAKLIVATILCVAFFILLLILLRNCAFAEIGNFEYWTRTDQLFRTPEISLEFNLRSILESEYYEAKAAHATPQTIELTERRPDGDEDHDTGLTTIRI